MAPVVRSLQQAAKKVADVDVRVCVTGQHRQMLDEVLRLFQIVPDLDLNIMQPGQDLTDITVHVLQSLRTGLREWRPDRILVHGDTSTAFAASLAAFYERIPVAHVEAGLRTGNMYSPWPEEMNRKLISSLADVHFAPTKGAQLNLVREGVKESATRVTGNTVIDALLDVARRLREDEALRRDVQGRFPFLDPERRLILVTGHRRENFGEPFERLCYALRTLAERGDTQIVYPVHLNPNVREPVQRILGPLTRRDAEGAPATAPIVLLEPVDYVEFVYLMDRSHMIITDSGGVQEEAPSLGKPVLVMRETTERPEAVAAGTVVLVGTDEERIVNEAARMLDDCDHYEAMAAAQNPYGDGYASGRIANDLLLLDGVSDTQVLSIPKFTAPPL